MVLTTKQIQAATQGAVYFTEEHGEVCFHRFSPTQERLYRSYREDFWRKTFATAGVKLCFRTNSSWMRLKVNALQTVPRTYFSLDVTVDGQIIGSICNMPEELPENYTTAICRLGEFERRFELGEGEKTVCVYFPWSVNLRIQALSLADGSLFEPIHPGKTLLMFGDSITQGYDAIHPSKRYGSLLADALGASEINKAIGGEVFFPPLAEAKEDLEPDYITVAYGTNDWSKTAREKLLKNARTFYSTLQRQYPRAKLVALLPIWRKDRDENRPYGSFDQMRQDLKKIAGELGVPVIDCYDFVPKDPSCFADLRLHPNDEGFVCYANALVDAFWEVEL